ncbi:hypothetical protein LXA47_14850 [Massilia sp. P8910]|uniref:hypothetical protein n=1 Tax=Massilia antarctica TaxID=2765360 RepID=UPI001E509E5E|nr:hypothetical protein [Massilia antarctica]MCE3604882.1 hypothetical protein [Massilia antarctica]
MNAQAFSALLLRARLAVVARGPLLCGACVLLVAAAAAVAWLLPQAALQSKRHAVALGLARTPAPVDKPAPVIANENLALFYTTLGEKRYVEQQVKTLFGIAAKSGLSLSQGDYKSGFDRNARLHTYQVTLPVKGSYNAIWKFTMLSLRAIPFASLDEISFKRDNIGEPALEARVRMTFYLADQPGAPQ